MVYIKIKRDPASGGLEFYLCITWGGDVALTHNIHRAMVVPDKAAHEIINELRKKKPCWDYSTEYACGSYSIHDKFHVENFPNP